MTMLALWVGAALGGVTLDSVEQRVLAAEIEVMELWREVSPCPAEDEARRGPPCPDPAWVGVAHPDGLWVLEMVDVGWATRFVDGAGLTVDAVEPLTEFAKRGREHQIQGFLAVDEVIVWAGRFDDGWAEISIRTKLEGRVRIAPPWGPGWKPPSEPKTESQEQRLQRYAAAAENMRAFAVHMRQMGPAAREAIDPSMITAEEGKAAHDMARKALPVRHDGDRVALDAARDRCDEVLSQNFERYALSAPKGAPSGRQLMEACRAVELASIDLPSWEPSAWFAGEATPEPGHLVIYAVNKRSCTPRCLQTWERWMQTIAVPQWHRGITVIGVMHPVTTMLEHEDHPAQRWPFPLAVVDTPWFDHVGRGEVPVIAVVDGQVVWSGLRPDEATMQRLLDAAGRP